MPDFFDVCRSRTSIWQPCRLAFAMQAISEPSPSTSFIVSMAIFSIAGIDLDNRIQAICRSALRNSRGLSSRCRSRWLNPSSWTRVLLSITATEDESLESPVNRKRGSPIYKFLKKVTKLIPPLFGYVFIPLEGNCCLSCLLEINSIDENGRAWIIHGHPRPCMVS